MYTKSKQNPLEKYTFTYSDHSKTAVFRKSTAVPDRICPKRLKNTPEQLRSSFPNRSVSIFLQCTHPKFVHLPAATAQSPHDHCKATAQPPPATPLNHNATTSAALQPRPTSKKQKRRPRRPPPIIISVLIRRAYSSASPIFPTTTATAAQAATATTAMAANFANAFILLPPCSFDFLYRGCTGTTGLRRDPPDYTGPTGLPGIRQPHLTLQTHHTQKPQDRQLSSLLRPHCCIMA